MRILEEGKVFLGTVFPNVSVGTQNLIDSSMLELKENALAVALEHCILWHPV